LRAVLIRCVTVDVNLIARDDLDELASVDGQVGVLTGQGKVLWRVVLQVVDIDGLQTVVDLLERRCPCGRRPARRATSPRSSILPLRAIAR
jgi:hypothetical protein